jgi:hypothetical protein
MEDSTICLGDAKSSYTREELAEKIYTVGKSKVRSLFQTYKNEMDFRLSQPHLSIDNKLELITDEIEKLCLTDKKLKLAKSPMQQKRQLIESLEMVLSSIGKRILPPHQFEIHTGMVSNSLLTLKKNAYLKAEFEMYVKKPETGEKINWLGTPSEFGLLINELVKAGYLEIAEHKRNKNKKSFLRTANLLYNAFHIPDVSRKGETTPGNINNEISKPSISNKEAGFFKITRMNRK